MGCGCKHQGSQRALARAHDAGFAALAAHNRKKKPCCRACALGLPCGSKVPRGYSRGEIIRHIQKDSKVFRHLLAEDRELVQHLRGEGMATRKKATKKKAVRKTARRPAKRKTTKKKARRKTVAVPMTRKQACMVICRQKYTKKAAKKRK